MSFITQKHSAIQDIVILSILKGTHNVFQRLSTAL